MIDQIYSGSLFEIKKYFVRETHENLDLDPEEHKKCQRDGLITLQEAKQFSTKITRDDRPRLTADCTERKHIRTCRQRGKDAAASCPRSTCREASINANPSSDAGGRRKMSRRGKKKTTVIESETENVKWGEKVRDGEGERVDAKIDI